MLYTFGLLVILISFTGSSIAQPTSDRDVVDMINKIDAEDSLYLFGGLSVEKSKSVLGRSMNGPSSHPDSLVERVARYMNSHELKFTVPDFEDEQRNGRSLSDQEEARSGKLKKIVLPLLLALKLKLAIVLPILLLAIKLISLKGLAAGLLALLFSGITLFKDLLAKKKDHVTTAFISGNPVNAEIVHHTDWSRTGQVASAQELAYNYHAAAALPQSPY